MTQSTTFRRTLRIGVITLFLLAPLVMTWAGFCWGGWFSKSALMQQLLQCRCPPQSEAIRYHPFIVIAPACVDPRFAGMSADTNWMLYKEYAAPQRTMLVDLRTLRQHSLPIPDGANLQFISPTLFLVSARQPNTTTRAYSLYDRATGRRTPLPLIDSWRKELTSDVLDQMRTAQLVYVSINYIVVFAESTNGQVNDSFIIQGGSWTPKLRAQIDAIQITYLLDPIFDYPSVTPDAIFSSNEQLSATREGIVNVINNNFIANIPAHWINLDPPWQPDYWVADDQAVFYRRLTTTVAGLGMWASIGPDWLVVPQPLLLLPATPDYRAPPQ
jgi:hypothetical protein